MFKKFLFLLQAVVLLLTLSSCYDNIGTSNYGTLVPSVSSDGTQVPFWEKTDTWVYDGGPVMSYDEVQSLYPDKTVLVWAVDGGNGSARTTEINEYLDSLGCDFAMCFMPVVSIFTTADAIEDILSAGTQIDIIGSFANSSADNANRSWHVLAREGWLEPLDEYLKNTEHGRKLYYMFPESYWKGHTVDGAIYSAIGNMRSLSGSYGYFVNTELAEKYGFDYTKPILDQMNIIKQVAQNENVVPAIYPYINFNYMTNDLELSAGGVYWDDELKCAKHYFENETFLERLEIYYELAKEGLLRSEDPEKNSFFIKFDTMYGGLAEMTEFDVNYNSNVVRSMAIFDKPVIIPTWFGTGICSTSENKDKAFELLMLQQTDPYLNNLFTYGVEGKDYNLNKNGCVTNLINQYNPDRFSNKLICHPLSNNDTAEGYCRILNEAVCSEDIGFSPDLSNVSEQNDRCFNKLAFMPDDIIAESGVKYDTFKEMVTAWTGILEENGVNDIISSINEQYSKYVSEYLGE